MKTASDYLGSLVDTLCLGPAVYFLFMDDEVVYIGSSIKPLGRISIHRSKNEGLFNCAKLLPMAKSSLIAIEDECIALFRPKYNIRGVKGKKCSERTDWIGSGSTDTVVLHSEVPPSILEPLDSKATKMGVSRGRAIRLAVDFWLANSEVLRKSELIHKIRH